MNTKANLFLAGSALLLGLTGKSGSAGKTIPVDDEDYNKMIDNLLMIQTPILKRFLTGKASYFQYLLAVLECPIEIENSIIKDIPNIKPSAIFLIPTKWKGKKIPTITKVLYSSSELLRIGLGKEITVDNIKKLVGSSSDFSFKIRKNKNGQFDLPLSHSDDIANWVESLNAKKDLLDILEINERVNFNEVASYSPWFNTITVNIDQFYTMNTKGTFKKKYGDNLKHEIRHSYEDAITKTYNVDDKKAATLLQKMNNILKKSIPQTSWRVFKTIGISKDDSIVISIFNKLISQSEEQLTNLIDDLPDEVNILANLMKNPKYNPNNEAHIIWDYISKYPMIDKSQALSIQLTIAKLSYSTGDSPILSQQDYRKYLDNIYMEKPSFTPKMNRDIVTAMIAARDITNMKFNLEGLRSSLERIPSVYRSTEEDKAYTQLIVEQKTHIGDVGSEILEHVWDFKTDSFTTDPKKIQKMQKRRNKIWKNPNYESEYDRMREFGSDASQRFYGLLVSRDDFSDDDRFEYLVSQYIIETMRVYKMIFDHYGK